MLDVNFGRLPGGRRWRVGEVKSESVGRRPYADTVHVHATEPSTNSATTPKRVCTVTVHSPSAPPIPTPPPHDASPQRDPFYPAPSDVIAKTNITMPQCAHLADDIRASGYRCFNEKPHAKDCKRNNIKPMTIQFKPGHENDVPTPRMYRTPKHLLPALKEIITKFLAHGWIRPSTSPFMSPCMVIPKPHQEHVPPDQRKYRFVCDMRALNKITARQFHRVPDISASWDKLANSQVFSVVDLTNGFYQCEIADDGSRQKTAFGCEFGSFEWVQLCQGLMNSPAHFTHEFEASLVKYGLLDTGAIRLDKPVPIDTDGAPVRPCCTPHLDDLIIFSSSVEQHVTDLRRVFTALSKERWFLNIEKCHLFCEYVKFLGGIVGNGLLFMDPAKVAAIQTWEQPRTPTELRSLLGAVNFLKRHVPNLASITATLNGLLTKGKSVKKDWNETHAQALRTLKNALCSGAVLVLPDFDQQFYIVSDACDHALGGMLAQDYDGHLRPVAYHSRKFTSAEKNYTVREQECLAIVDCLRKFEHYLLGARFTIRIQTDHNSLQFLQQGVQPLRGRLARWENYLAEFDYEISYIPGPSNTMGDALSRSFNDTCSPHEHPHITPIHEVDRRHTEPITAFHVATTYVTHDKRFATLDYSTCPEFKDVFATLSTPTTDGTIRPHRLRYYNLRHGRLHYHFADGSNALCIPSTLNDADGNPMRHVLVAECHDSPYMGHRGIAGTYLHMRNLFYWKNMHKMVQRYVSSCTTCARAKALW